MVESAQFQLEVQVLQKLNSKKYMGLGGNGLDIVNKKIMNKKEEILQAECTQWHWNTFPMERQMLFCVNNNSTNKIKGNKKKAVGVVAGISDLVFIGDGEVIFIELKTDEGLQSKEQIEFQTKVKHRLHRYVVIRSFDEFATFITKYYGTRI